MNDIRQILTKSEIGAFLAGGEIDPIYEKVYDFYFDEIPYGVHKARDGDPYLWCSERLMDDLRPVTIH